MRPDAKYQRSRRYTTARTRGYLKAHLDWLTGFPLAPKGDGITWWCLTPTPGATANQLQVTRAIVRQAEFTIKRLHLRELAQLDETIEVPATWLARAEQLLEQIKAIIHTDATLATAYTPAIEELSTHYRGLRNSIIQQYPHLQRVVDSFSWIYSLRPRTHAAAIRWMSANRDLLAQVVLAHQHDGNQKQIEWAVTIWQLVHTHGDTTMCRLIHDLAKPVLDEIPLLQEECEQYAKDWINYLGHQNHPNDRPLPEPPKSRLGDMIRDFVQWLCRQTITRQAIAIEFYNVIVDDHLFPEIIASRKQLADAVADAIPCCRVMAHTPVHVLTRAAAIANFQVLLGQGITSYRLNRFTSMLDRLFQNDNQDLIDELQQVMPLIPVTVSMPLTRIQFFDQFTSRFYGGRSKRVQRSLNQLRKYLQCPNREQRLRPWLDQKSHAFSDVHDLSYCTEERERAFYAALRTLIDDQQLHDCLGLKQLKYLAESLPQIDILLPCFRELGSAQLLTLPHPNELILCAGLLHQLGLNFGQAVQQLAGLSFERLQNTHRAINELMKVNRGDMAHTLFVQRKFDFLNTIGERLAMVNGLSRLDIAACPVITSNSPPAWVQHYPATLHEPLERLAALSPRAEEIANRLLRQNFRLPTDIQQEIDAIRSRLSGHVDDGRLQLRLQHLQQRLINPAPVSVGRLHHLRILIELAGIRSWIDRWLTQRLNTAQEELRTLLETQDIPDWLWTVPNLKIVSAILSLRDRFRQLGLRVVHKRFGPAPWNFHEEPANQQFITRLRQRGIDPQVWLEPPPDEWIENKNGERFRVGIERDRFEILRMGEPFNTCLATDGANFFSAVANAVDINKHVIYIRDRKSMIVGRCLLALTEWGQLLTYNVYTNVPDLDLPSWVNRFVISLASRMQTHCVLSGVVPSLVAPDWYNDGAIEMGNDFPFLVAGSAFRCQLASIPVDDFMCGIESACHPLPLNDVVLHAVIQLPELDQRPELLQPLLPAILPLKRWPETIRWRVARLANAGGRADLTLAMIDAQAINHLVRQIQRHGICECCTKPILETLLETNPSFLIRAVRQSRDSSVRSDEDEYHHFRRELLSKAHARLARPKLAERLRQNSRPK